MLKNVDGKIVEMTPEEVSAYEAEQLESERIFWSRPYNELVNELIRGKYPLSDELAILRQKDEKPEEYREYFQFCEKCKADVKQKKAELGVV